MSRRHSEQPHEVREMFERISPRYNLLNRLITFGRDRAWRRAAVRMTRLPVGGRLLDAGTGTGDLAFETLRQDPTARVVGMDFTRTMMDLGRCRPGGHRVLWCRGDAVELPFPDAFFDGIVSGFLMRNVDDVTRAFGEQRRVVVPGGRVVCLDTSPPPKNLLQPFILLHLRLIIPMLGLLIARNRAAYTYLPTSTRAFLRPEELASRMVEAGLVAVRYRRFMFGTIAVHAGVRPF